MFFSSSHEFWGAFFDDFSKWSTPKVLWNFEKSLNILNNEEKPCQICQLSTFFGWFCYPKIRYCVKSYRTWNRIKMCNFDEKSSFSRQNFIVELTYFFQILWKSGRYIFDTFPSHFKKLHSILKFWLEKLIWVFFSLVSLMKKRLHINFSPQNFQCRK